METKWVSCPIDFRFREVRWETVVTEVGDNTDGTLAARDVDGITKWSHVNYGEFVRLTNADVSNFEDVFRELIDRADHKVSFEVGKETSSLYEDNEGSEERQLGQFERLLYGDIPEDELPMDFGAGEEHAMDEEEISERQEEPATEEDDEEFEDLFD